MKCFGMIRHNFKIDIRPRPVSIFSDPVLSSQFLKSRGWPLYTGSTVCILLTSNHMIFLMQFGINEHL